MKHVPALSFCLALVATATAQPVVVLDAARDGYVLDAALELLEDPSRRLQVDDLAGASFVGNEGGVPNRGYSDAAYWVRFRLRDTAPGRPWLLVLDNPNVSLVELLVADTAGARPVYRTGTRRPFHARPVEHPAFVLPLDLPAGATATFYLHLVFEEPVRIPLRVWSAEAFYARDRRLHLVVGAFYGVLVIMAVYHLLLFVSIRDRSYLYFALFMLSLGLLAAGGEGLSYAYLWPAAVDWNQQSKGLLNGLTMLFGLLFARRFLDTGRVVPRVDVALRALAMLSALLVVFKCFVFLEDATAWRDAYSRSAAAALLAGALGLYARRAKLGPVWAYHPAVYLWTPLAFLGGALFLAFFADDYTPAFDRATNAVVSIGGAGGIGMAGLRAWRQGFRPAAPFLGGMGGFLGGGLVESFTHVGLLPYTPATQWSMEGGMAAALGLLSLSLGDRINLLRGQAGDAAAEAQAAGRRAAEARFEALQAKINPHFLFNVLNTIAGLIRLDPVRAERAVEKLARLFRYTLHRTGRGLVPLPEELAMVRAYLELEQLRLEERLVFEIVTEGDLTRVRVPALVVQPLVENSIKHGVAARAAGGRIVVRAAAGDGQCRIVVRDDGPGWVDAPAESGHGLASIRERLRLTFGDAFEMTIREDAGVVVEMILPLASDAAFRVSV